VGDTPTWPASSGAAVSLTLPVGSRPPRPKRLLRQVRSTRSRSRATVRTRRAEGAC
jgi:hypothetical protein